MSTLTHKKMMEMIERINDLVKPPDFDTILSNTIHSGMLHGVAGLKIVTSPNITRTVQTKFPRCNKKKNRVVKKFAKKYSVQNPDYNVYLIDTSKLFCMDIQGKMTPIS